MPFNDLVRGRQLLASVTLQMAGRSMIVGNAKLDGGGRCVWDWLRAAVELSGVLGAVTAGPRNGFEDSASERERFRWERTHSW